MADISINMENTLIFDLVMVWFLILSLVKKLVFMTSDSLPLTLFILFMKSDFIIIFLNLLLK